MTRPAQYGMSFLTPTGGVLRLSVLLLVMGMTLSGVVPSQAMAHRADDAGDPAFPERPDGFGHMADRGAVDWPDRLEAMGIGLGSCAIEQGQEAVYHIVHMHQVQGCGRIANIDRQVACDLVAESGHGRVVERAAPFAEHVG